VLGVDWGTVRGDYLVSNRVRAAEVEKRLAKMRSVAALARGVDPNDVDMTNMEAFMVQDGRYIDASRDQMLADYGSLDIYFRNGLGLTDTVIDQLRDQLVTPSP
jgi:protein tyrosine/serine phosphatase